MAKRDSLRLLTWALIRAARQYRLAADTRLLALGLSDATALPVLFLQRLGGNIRQGQLAEQLAIEGPSLTRVLDQLEEQRLIERREDPLDRRAKLLALTRQGRELSQTAESALDKLRTELFSDISQAEFTTCLSVLNKLTERLQKREADPK